jgi:RNA polymerase sigma factor (sigma-70 family)
MKYQSEECVRKGGIPHQVSEYPAIKYLKSDNEEVKRWAGSHADELELLDNRHESTRRWIKKHQDGREFQIAELSFYRSSKGRSNGQPAKPENRWLEEIFSQDPKDLHQLVSSSKLSKAIQSLTAHQRKILHMSAIQQMKTKEIAEKLGTSSRNILDVLKRTCKRIKTIMNNQHGEGYVPTCAMVLGWITIPTFMFGWEISKRIYPPLKRKILSLAV